jgi:hypothetical protein
MEIRIRTTLVEPFIVCAVSSVATSRGRPTLTPASASDSKMMYANTGPLVSLVQSDFQRE